MKKIHITEEQLNYLKKRLTEDNQATPSNPAEFEVQKTDGGNGGITGTDVKNAAEKVKSLVGSGSNLRKTELTVDTASALGSTTLEEGKTITKRQIKEAKLKKLQENCTVYLKKNLK